eukprot:589436-Rhodomonas_salina.1
MPADLILSGPRTLRAEASSLACSLGNQTQESKQPRPRPRPRVCVCGLHLTSQCNSGVPSCSAQPESGCCSAVSRLK